MKILYFGSCSLDPNIVSIVSFIKDGILPLIQLGVPILLIIMGCIDLGKIVISQDDKIAKESSSRLIRRIILAVACFFMVTLVNLVTDLLIKSESDDVYNSDKCTWQDYWRD